MNIKKTLPAVAGFFIAASAFAVQHNLPTPPPCDYPDTESSLNVPLPDWPALGRRITLSLTANFTPSNNVQIAFGQDTNSDGDLAPEETHLVLGVDCGVPFIRDEVEEEGRGGQRWLASVSNGEAVSSPLVSEYPPAQQPEGTARRGAQESNLDCPPPPSTSTFVFAFKQPSSVSSRVTHAKITTRGRGPTAAQIAAEIRKPGKLLFLR